jgi:D-3-phosphoglycerate dehydrogenase
MPHRLQAIDIENKPLVLDLLEWVVKKPRTYAEVMDAWRTSCPRLPIWEDSVRLGLLRTRVQAGTHMVAVTAAGRALLMAERPDASASLIPGPAR